MTQTTPAQGQQRAFVRVDDSLPLAWRRIDEARFQEVVAHFEKHRIFPQQGLDVHQIMASLDVTDALRLLEQSDPMLARVLVRLDQKLNLLLRLFHPGETERPMVLTPVNLSGGGISFLDRDPGLSKGDVLEIRLALSVDSLTVIDCFARVMMVVENMQEELTRVACRFEPILDTDRERLIQYIFQRQSELLRAKKGY
ncbi:MAG: PilZ domain-containing protein [Magnetococcales bacterium]|nr:PilZ domain-containing protein [Magnetococcales bacterium]NGZ05017.1 PilZ domain-containing protein [Magnetococcales bacterium]